MYLGITRRILIATLAILTGFLTVGCGDEVKVVRQSETVYESPAQPVAPGEPIVE